MHPLKLVYQAILELQLAAPYWICTILELDDPNRYQLYPVNDISAIKDTLVAWFLWVIQPGLAGTVN
jgi:hypothetical protein